VEAIDHEIQTRSHLARKKRKKPKKKRRQESLKLFTEPNGPV